MKYLIAAITLLIVGFPTHAQDSKLTASALLTNCLQETTAAEHKAYTLAQNGHPFTFDKTDKEGTAAVYSMGYCGGYLTGRREGRDQSQAVVDGKAYVITVLSAGLDNTVAALRNHLTSVPLDNDKRADDVLFQVFLDNKLIQLQEIPVKPTTASVPCGAPTAYRIR